MSPITTNGQQAPAATLSPAASESPAPAQEYVDGRPVGAAQIKVIGVGGGGCNAVRRMSEVRIPGVEFLMVNTDVQSLKLATDSTKVIRLGDRVTRGLGAGGDPRIGERAAQETRSTVSEALAGADLVFITAGMGGGTGTGAAPVVAEAAKSQGALAVALVTTPFSFEGARRAMTATTGLAALKDKVDTMILISNDRLLKLAPHGTRIQDAFKMIDEVVMRSILAISRIINVPGEINVDFADIRAILASAGTGIMAIGRGSGEKRTLDASHNALQNPLLDISMQGAKGVLFVVSGGPDLELAEVNAAGELIGRTADPEAQIFFGMDIQPELQGNVEITLVATHLPADPGGKVEGGKPVNLSNPAPSSPKRSYLEDDVPSFLRNR